MTSIERGPRFRRGQQVKWRTVEGWEPAVVLRVFEPTPKGVSRYLIECEYRSPRSGATGVCAVGLDEIGLKAA